MLGEGYGSPENVFQAKKGAPGQKKSPKRDADDDERGRGKFSYTSLRNISRICRNIEEYVPKDM